MADALLDRLYDAEAIDWAGGYDLQKNDRHSAYIDALKAADDGDITPLMQFVGPRADLQAR